jgi:hypothetical protein
MRDFYRGWMSEVACDPELPPLLISKWMNSERTTAFDFMLEVTHGRGDQSGRQ